MSIRSSIPASQGKISSAVAPEALKAEQAKKPEAPPSAKAQPLADTQVTAKAKEPASPAPSAAAVGAYQTSTIVRAVPKKPEASQSLSDAPPPTGTVQAFSSSPSSATSEQKGEKKTAPEGLPSQDLPGRDAPNFGRGELVVPGGGSQTVADAAAAAGFEIPGQAPAENSGSTSVLTDTRTARPGFDQGGTGLSASEQAALAQAGSSFADGNPIAALTSQGIGGQLGADAASDIQGIPNIGGAAASGLVSGVDDELATAAASGASVMGGFIVAAAGVTGATLIGSTLAVGGGSFKVARALDNATGGAISGGVAGTVAAAVLAGPVGTVAAVVSLLPGEAEAEAAKVEAAKKAEAAKEAEAAKSPEQKAAEAKAKKDEEAKKAAEAKKAEDAKKAEPKPGGSKKGTVKPAPEGEGRRFDDPFGVVNSDAHQRQLAALGAGRRGHDVTPAPENQAVSSGLAVPGASQTQQNLVGQPGGAGVSEGGAIRTGPDYNGTAGAIDLGPDAVQTTAGGRTEDPADFIASGGPPPGPGLPPQSDSSSEGATPRADLPRQPGQNQPVQLHH